MNVIHLNIIRRQPVEVDNIDLLELMEYDLKYHNIPESNSCYHPAVMDVMIKLHYQPTTEILCYWMELRKTFPELYEIYHVDEYYSHNNMIGVLNLKPLSPICNKKIIKYAIPCISLLFMYENDNNHLQLGMKKLDRVWDHDMNIMIYNVRLFTDYLQCHWNTDDIPEYILQLSEIDGVNICGGYVLSKIRNKSKFQYTNTDIDIFITAHNVVQLNDILRKICIYINETGFVIKKYDNDHCIDLYVMNNSKKYHLQIIKRCYESLYQILMGFDLDSSCIALKNRNIYYNNRFEWAYTNNANMIRPTRQSKSYNYRLNKYFRRGFIPIGPFKIPRDKLISKVKLWSNDDWHLNYHNIYGLFMMTNFVKWYKHQKETDYDEMKLSKLYINEITGQQIVNELISDDKWKWHEPGTQVNGSFHPLKQDYFLIVASH